MTTEARAKVASLMAEWLHGGTISVSNAAGESASAPATIRADGATITAEAVFDAATANFHWLRRELRADDGTLVDGVDQDYGTKALGAIWTLEVPLEVVQ